MSEDELLLLLSLLYSKGKDCGTGSKELSSFKKTVLKARAVGCDILSISEL